MYLQCNVEEFNAAVAAGRDELILMDLAPGTIIQSILCIESKAQSPTVSNNPSQNAVYKHASKPMKTETVIGNDRETTDRGKYEFTALMPLGDKFRICTRPFPTRPKFCEEVTARRESL
jgi:hypothetical protein